MNTKSVVDYDPELEDSPPVPNRKQKAPRKKKGEGIEQDLADADEAAAALKLATARAVETFRTWKAAISAERNNEQALLQKYANTRTVLKQRDDLGLIPADVREKLAKFGWFGKKKKG